MSEKETKKGSKVMPALFALILLSGAGLWYFSDQDSEPLASEPLVFAIPSIVVNLEDKNPRHYLKVSTTIVTRHIELNEKLPTYQPQLRNFMIRQFRKESINSLAHPDSFERLRIQTLEGIRKLLQDKSGISAVDDLLFTEFVIQ